MPIVYKEPEIAAGTPVPALLLRCSIPAMPESVNRVWRNGRGRHAPYKTAKTREFQNALTAIMQRERKYPPYGGRVSLTLKITRHDRRRWDLDNRIKVVQDCLAPAGVVVDDSQVTELHCFKCVGKSDLTEIEVWTLMEAEQPRPKKRRKRAK